jgi:hypothetical protein
MPCQGLEHMLDIWHPIATQAWHTRWVCAVLICFFSDPPNIGTPSSCNSQYVSTCLSNSSSQARGDFLLCCTTYGLPRFVRGRDSPKQTSFEP